MALKASNAPPDRASATLRDEPPLQPESRDFDGELQDHSDELAVARDVVETEQRRYRELFEFAPDGYLVTCEKGTIQEANRAAGELLGAAPEHLIGTPLVLSVAGEQRAAFLTELRNAGESQTVRLLETTLLPRDRGPLAAEVRIGAVRSAAGRLVGFRWLVRDVTERRDCERRAKASGEQLRALWARLESVREEEQTRIARELHDEFGQAVTALKFDLDCLARDARRSPEGGACLDRIAGQLDQMLDAVRRISRELRPSVLDDLGLEAAAEWYTREFEGRTGIRCPLVSTFSASEIDRTVATAAFRILQEALTNVARHSGARRAEVRLSAGDGRLTLTVTDDGIGVPPDRISDGKSLGFVGMRERARLVDGSLAIEALTSGGTRVSLSLPRRLSK